MSDERRPTPAERLAQRVADGGEVVWENERRHSTDDRLSGLELLEAVGRVFKGEAAGEPVLFEWGPLQLLEKLGEGAFGEVYRALDPQLGRQVALKLRKGDDGASESEEWLEEARRLARIRHRNVLTVHGAGSFDGRQGIWSDLIEGETLQARQLRDGPMGAGELVAVGSSLLQALAAIHAAGMVHGDVKPSNLVREVGGRLVLVDLGAGGSIGAAEAATRGSPQTAAPERIRGEPSSARADLYSAGATLYQLAAGRPPIEAGSLGELAETDRAATPLRDLRPDLPAELVDVIEQSLSFAPGDRFATAGEMEARLRRSVSGGRRKMPSHRRSAARHLTLTLVALAAVGAAWWWSAARRPVALGPAHGELEVTRLQAQGTAVFAAISPDGRYVSYLSDFGEKSAIRLHQVATGSDLALAEFTRHHQVNYIGFTPDGAYVRYTLGELGQANRLFEVPVLGGPASRLLDDVVLGLTFSPDGSEAVYVSGTEMDQRWQRLERVRLADRDRRTILEVEDEWDIENAAWSPKGDRLALSLSDTSADRLMLLPAEGGELEPVVGDPFFAIGDLCWLPDGRRMIVVGSETERDTVRQSWLVDVETGDRRRLLRDVSNSFGCSTTADGRRTVLTRHRTQSRLWVTELEEGSRPSLVNTTTGFDDGVSAVAWIDDDWVAYVAPDGDTYNLWRVPIDGGTSERLTTGGAEAVTASRAGSIAYEAGWSRDNRQGIYLMEFPSRAARRLSPDGVYAEVPALSPDGRTVAYSLLGAERLQLVVQAVDGGEPRVVFDGPAHAATFSPDGLWLALHALHPEERVWKTAVFPVDGNGPTEWLDIHSDSMSPWLSMETVLVSKTVDRVGNVLAVPRDNSGPRPITAFQEGMVFSFAVSPTGDRLVVARGDWVSDLLLYEGHLPTVE